MLNSKCFQTSNFYISLPVSVIYFKLFVVIFMCFSFFLLLFCVSYELGRCLVMVLRMLWYCAKITFLSQNLVYNCIYLI